jgi:hypothetical protein
MMDLLTLLTTLVLGNWGATLILGQVVYTLKSNHLAHVERRLKQHEARLDRLEK